MPGRHRSRVFTAICLAVAVAGCGSSGLNAPHPTAGPSFAAAPSERRVELRIEDGQLTGAGTTPEVRTWIEQAAQAIDAYYGRFPVGHARLLVEPVDGSGVRWARTFAHSGADVRVGVGVQTTATEFASDWILTHEFVHLALPEVWAGHGWL